MKKDVLTIRNSYLVREEAQMLKGIDRLIDQWPESDVWIRSNASLLREWKAHNLLYDLHLFREHTKDVDFEYPQKWYTRVAWFVLSQFYTE